MTQENTGDRDEARRMNEDATRRASWLGTVRNLRTKNFGIAISVKLF